MQRIILPQKFLTKDNFNKQRQIILLILILKISGNFIEIIPNKHFVF